MMLSHERLITFSAIQAVIGLAILLFTLPLDVPPHASVRIPILAL